MAKNPLLSGTSQLLSRGIGIAPLLEAVAANPGRVSIESLISEQEKKGRVHMNSNILRFCRRCLVIAALLPVGIKLSPGANPPIVSGSYDVLRDKDLGAQVQVLVRIHLVNHGPTDLSIQRMTLWDFSHPERGASHACAFILAPHSSVDSTEEFVISRSDYQQWRRGFRPRFVLEMAGRRKAAGRPITKSTVVVRLDRMSDKEGN
jgi:hypothetical protein